MNDSKNLAFADFHAHPSTKTMVRGSDSLYDISEAPPQYYSKAGRSHYAAYHQSDPVSLHKGRVRITHAAMLCLEKFTQRSRLGKWLSAFSFISGIKREWQKTYFHKNHTYWHALIKEIQHLKSIGEKPKKTEGIEGEIWNQFQIVKSLKDLLSTEKPLKIIANIEGMHSFINNVYDYAEPVEAIKKRIDLFKKVDISREEIDELLSPSNIPSQFAIKRDSEAEQVTSEPIIKGFEPIPIFSIGLCHFEYNHLYGETTGVPIPGILEPYGPKRVAKSMALNREGKEIIEYLLYHKENSHRRILIDVKHAGPRARAAFYKLKKKYEREHNEEKKIPIICTHTGVSGFETLEEAYDAPDSYWSWKYAPYDRFNPMPINLCNEDIKEIYESKGIIGILLEQRVLGDMRKYVGLFGKTKYHKRVLKFLEENGAIERHAQYSELMLVHAIMFLDNVFQCIEVMSREEDFWKSQDEWDTIDLLSPWDCVCIGSDFDGSIDPIDCCPSAEHLPHFRELITQLLLDKKLCSRFSCNPSNEELESCLDRLFYKNVERFTHEQIEKNW